MFFGQVEPTAVTSFEPVTTTTEVSDTGLAAFFTAYFFVLFVVIVLSIIANWKIFEKAGEAGWKSIVPFLNTFTFFRIAGRNGWGFLLMLVPFVNIIVWIVVSMDLAKHFGKSGAYGFFFVFFFPFVGALDLGFGEAKYVGPKHA